MRILRQQDAMDCGLACLLTISLEVKSPWLSGWKMISKLH